ncbi:pyridoxamine 5'-phosphate oxidase family protein [Roseateles amylovorans]|uniref:Pyridoxamine 5'-phosphate oxidase family protein n=1 Tax=Roseateles amylovorans TaxID=2978473 RepID=A0ABY6B6K4_9BURK|nr:pyridoxamine 5'-phosphate oxidase family protein [Roseateles amylovorans]UXH80554.1 pyridoxamine 5'-phosphate oxidase family protein [Roseateles amylovorans]
MSELAQNRPSATGTDPLTPTHPQAEQPAISGGSRLSQLVAGQRIAMLATVLADGSIDSKPMTLLELDADGALWFFCEHHPDDDAAHERYRRVNLSFSDEVRSVYVSIAGRGELLHDKARLRELWTQQARPFFPEGPESERLAALKVTPDRSEYWESSNSLLVRGAALSVGG